MEYSRETQGRKQRRPVQGASVSYETRTWKEMPERSPERVKLMCYQ